MKFGLRTTMIHYYNINTNNSTSITKLYTTHIPSIPNFEYRKRHSVQMATEDAQ